MPTAFPHAPSHPEQGPAIVAVSGGMDSMLALTLLAEQNRVLAAAWARFLPQSERDDRTSHRLQQLCRQLGLPLLEIDLREAFDRLVQEPFLLAYLQGRTPNPCALCNPRIKFGLLLQEAAARLDAPHACLATGHYAGLRNHPEHGAMLAPARDASKDQCYFLSLLPKAVLSRLVFPLAGVCKKDVPALLLERGLEAPRNQESQEICFIPDNDYRGYIQRQARERGVKLPGPGPVLLPDGREIARHKGLWQYTQGQRRGLGIPWQHPLYVLGKDCHRNALLVGGADQRRTAGCLLEEVNYFAPLEQWPGTVLARLRYRQRPRRVQVEKHGQGLQLLFADPAAEAAEAADGPPAPGQLGVCYSEDGLVLAGGVIKGAVPLSENAGGLHG